MTLIGFVSPAIGLTIVTFIGCNPAIAVFLLCVSLMLEGTCLSGFNVNHLELSPNYAGTLRGATSTVANICGFVTPTLAGALTQGQVSMDKGHNWEISLLTAGVERVRSRGLATYRHTDQYTR